MEKTPSQDTEENPYLCFQRTPSLRRKWRKRYGGLDGNKLLEPNKEEDMRENDVMTEAHEERNPSPVKGAESQDTASSGNVPRPMPRNSFQSQSQRPVNLVSPGSTGLPSLVSNGALKPPLPQAEQERPVATSPQPWLSVGRTETTHGHSKRRAAADVLFDSFASDGRVSMNQFFETVWSSGLHRSDPRIKDCYFHMRKLQDEDGTVDRNTFQRCVTGFVSLILKALQGRFVIPDFATFTDETQKLFMKCKQLSSVKQEKDSGDSAKWGVSVCTVDGQRLSLGDCAESCVLEEVSWPLVYGIAIDQLGVDNVHRYVGMEEFSKYDSPFTLTKQGVPHSPLIETGAIITASLLQLAASLGAEEEEKYESVLNAVKRLCNKEHANLNCTSYQSLRKDSIRLHALSFYLQEKKCFPETVDINATLDLMLQCASTEVTCESGAAMAASLANGGLCPLSGDQVLSPSATKSMLSMMQVAGMNEYSRIFNFKTSAPAKSSKSGVMLAVVPGVLGLLCWSPDLDSFGNCWKAVHFCEELISTFQLHSFDIRTPFRQVLTYRQWKAESEGYQIMNILLAAFKGDIQSLRRYFLSGADVNAVDYDGRSALHVAASEGHCEVIRFLVENTGTNYSLKDRWGNTPMQEAMRHSHGPAAQLLRKYEEQPVTL
ncbi:glutaminase liver isoform, mitochondrial isoform X1 [Coregonus clupeaformis]|uniref:glutaminase liver isoform, mitochondrial isoform X1 n=2 Tax=Coregonus clupeaformis TaxID=59861 RepID=UPI001BDFC7AE|nr:glutaminase liver isoform, mitochondrial isoform X1 [Coregonus clupeaformis]XP_041693970.1 glutaminase liver isoform, mitochondrial isoform X1 [Coregonus clupeaformis]